MTLYIFQSGIYTCLMWSVRMSLFFFAGYLFYTFWLYLRYMHLHVHSFACLQLISMKLFGISIHHNKDLKYTETKLYIKVIPNVQLCNKNKIKHASWIKVASKMSHVAMIRLTCKDIVYRGVSSGYRISYVIDLHV